MQHDESQRPPSASRVELAVKSIEDLIAAAATLKDLLKSASPENAEAIAKQLIAIRGFNGRIHAHAEVILRMIALSRTLPQRSALGNGPGAEH